MKDETSSEYSERKMLEYGDITHKGKGTFDLYGVKVRGINTRKNPIDYYLWEIVKDWIKNNPTEGYNVKEIYEKIQTLIDSLRKENPTCKNYDDTYLHHRLNKFQYIGLLERRIVDKKKKYFFEPIIIEKGLDWFRIGNKYMRGGFQSEYGIFKIMELESEDTSNL